MKKIALFAVIFVCGALSYAAIQTFTTKQNQPAEINPPVASTTPPEQTEIIIDEPQNIELPEDTVTLAPDGTQLDGPFIIFNTNGEAVGGTVRIIRSPSEILLQFENFEGTYANASHVYFADDREASNYLDLSPARFTDGIEVYGVPLDADLESYNYILIFDRQLEETEFYAQIR